MLNGVLYTPWSDGNIYRRTFDGTIFGPATALNLYVLTALATDARNVTGMFYDKGRIYYTLANQASLFHRYFTPESGGVRGAAVPPLRQCQTPLWSLVHWQ